MKHIIIGAIIKPNISPNLIQILLSGYNTFGLNIANNKNIKDKTIDHSLIYPEFNNGHKPIIKKIKKNKKPKFFSEFFILKFNILVKIYFNLI